MTFRWSHSYFKLATAAAAVSGAALFPVAASAATFELIDGLISFTAEDILTSVPGVDLIVESGGVTPAAGFELGLEFDDTTDFVFSDDSDFTSVSGSINLAGVIGNTLLPLQDFSGVTFEPTGGNIFAVSDSVIGFLFNARVDDVIDVGESLILEGAFVTEPGSILSADVGVRDEFGTFRIDATAAAVDDPGPGSEPSTSVPEPGTVFALLGAAGAFWTSKRK
ncbi:MAG: PEP-CTERM sorting domain-containing protein [Cyanobacteria bacterium P01_F01_bin.13]